MAAGSCAFWVAGCSFVRHEIEAAEGSGEHVGISKNVIEEGFVSCFAQLGKRREVRRHEMSACAAANKGVNSLSLELRGESPPGAQHVLQSGDSC